MDTLLYNFVEEASKTKEQNRDDAKCVDLASAYITAHPELETRFGHLTLEQIVADVSYYRQQERTEDMWQASAWLRAMYEPQKIGGAGKVTLRKPGGK